MKSSLERVLHAARSGSPDESWIESMAMIVAERSGVEALLTGTNSGIYGFNTLLGQLDSLGSTQISQEALLDAHLVGPPSSIDSSMVRLISACKIEQLSHCGSGIHPATYRQLLHAIDVPIPCEVSGSWYSSYGAGDVVPAAWWVNALRGSGLMKELQQGDVIALINGSFMSTAFAVRAAIVYTGFVSKTLAWLCELGSVGPRTDWASDSAQDAWELIRTQARTPARNGSQLPISLRDIEPFAIPILYSVDRLGRSLQSRLERKSANPLFVETGGHLVAVSQNSYLDITLTLALTEAHQTFHLASGLIQRMIHHVCARRLAEEPNQNQVQPPKVAAALMAAADRASSLPTRFTGDESEGIEDVHDLSLLTAQGLEDKVRNFGAPLLSILSLTAPNGLAAPSCSAFVSAATSSLMADPESHRWLIGNWEGGASESGEMGGVGNPSKGSAKTSS